MYLDIAGLNGSWQFGSVPLRLLQEKQLIEELTGEEEKLADSGLKFQSGLFSLPFRIPQEAGWRRDNETETKIIDDDQDFMDAIDDLGTSGGVEVKD